MSEGLPKISPLVEGDYSRWEREMAAWLRYKGWYSTVSGLIPCPPAPESGSTPTPAYISWIDVDSRGNDAVVELTLPLSKPPPDKIKVKLTLYGNPAIGGSQGAPVPQPRW